MGIGKSARRGRVESGEGLHSAGQSLRGRARELVDLFEDYDCDTIEEELYEASGLRQRSGEE